MAATHAPAATAHRFVLLPVGQSLLRRAMRGRGMTMSDLAGRLGISRKHLSNILNGHAPLLGSLAHALPEAVGLIYDDIAFLLMAETAEPPPLEPGCLRGTIVINYDPTEPMEGWDMLEE
jgi:transcriptional regulator with XRE-family HTH domain